MPAELSYLVYTSIATKLMNEPDLFNLFDQSRRNNIAEGLTGVLLYMEGKFITKTEGRFLQVLEGNNAAIQYRYDKICLDERNKSVLMLSRGSCTERFFADWSMGFFSVNTEQHDSLAGFFNLHNGLPAFRDIKDGNGVERLLASFVSVNLTQ